MVNEHVAWLFAGSEAMQRTLVMPFCKVAPLGGLQATVTICELSVAVTV